MKEIVHEMFSEEQVAERIAQLAGQINEKYYFTKISHERAAYKN